MHSILLEPVDNGIIKTITDDNSNGGGSNLELRKIYEFDYIKSEKTIEFLYELINDLGIELGNIHTKENIVIDFKWGSSYRPTQEELKEKINSVRNDLLELETSYMYKHNE